MDYPNHCGSCEYLKDMKDPTDTEYFCGTANEKGHCVILQACFYPDDYVCSAYKVRGETGGYITTIVCNILGFSDDCGILNTLRDFRDNVMQKDIAYKEMLYEYDTIGPKIAANLKKDFKDSEDNDLVHELYNFYIQPTARLVEDKKYEEAVERYKEMTNALKDYYHIEEDLNIEDNYDYENGGHGVKKLGTIGG